MIIHKQIDGGVGVIVAADSDAELVIAQKDVPAGMPYLILGNDDIPKDENGQMIDPKFWDVDFSAPDGVGIGHDAYFAKLAKDEAQKAKEAQKVENETIKLMSIKVSAKPVIVPAPENKVPQTIAPNELHEKLAQEWVEQNRPVEYVPPPSPEQEQTLSEVDNEQN